MADGTYPPHPLVAELAMGLKKADEALSERCRDLTQARQAERELKQGEQCVAAQQKAEAAGTALADAIARDAHLPDIHTFAGFLGGVIDDSHGETKERWQLLYLDPKLRTWLLIDKDSILLRKEVRDETSPYGTRDHVWLRSDASVSEGDGAPQEKEVQARFLRGDFVSAGDFAASVTGGTFAPVTGPLCPLTPGCCGKKTK